MAANGIRPQHRLGQNFLVDVKVLDRIVEAANPSSDDLVLEIGPGFGALTERLAGAGGRVLAIELDRKLVQILGKTLQAAHPNLEVIQGDAGTADLRSLLLQRLAPGQRAKVAANLPYYITTPLVMRLLEEDLPISDIVVMVQREVAGRMVSPPGSKEYGALSVAVQYFTEPYIVANVPRSAFMPPPDVDSAVVGMRVRQSPPVEGSRADFFRVVKAAFGQRRKTIANALSAGLNVDRQQVQIALTTVGVDAGRRGETLSLEEFARIARILLKDTSQSPENGVTDKDLQ